MTKYVHKHLDKIKQMAYTFSPAPGAEPRELQILVAYDNKNRPQLWYDGQFSHSETLEDFHKNLKRFFNMTGIQLLKVVEYFPVDTVARLALLYYRGQDLADHMHIKVRIHSAEFISHDDTFEEEDVCKVIYNCTYEPADPDYQPPDAELDDMLNELVAHLVHHEKLPYPVSGLSDHSPTGKHFTGIYKKIEGRQITITAHTQRDI